MRAASLTMLVFVFFTQSPAAQVPIAPKLLTPSSVRNMSVPWFPSWGNPACDKDGDMYFHVARSYSETEILRLSADGSEGKIFKVTDQFPEASEFLFSNFSVTPGGNVYVLGVIPKRRAFLLLRFDEDGKLDEPISPRLPAGVTLDRVVATDTSTVLIFGFYYTTAPPGLKDKSYVALLDASGAVRQELHVSIPGLDIAKWAAGEVRGPDATLGDDGNFYLGGPNQILVVSPGGEMLRRIPFDNPYPDSTVDRLQVFGGLIVMTLALVDNDHGVHFRYLTLLNPSGATVGYYDAPGGSAARAVCYSPKQGLTFLKTENGQLKLLTAPFQ